MPAYTNLRTFVNALKTGRTHITDCLDRFFKDLNKVQNHAHGVEFLDLNGVDWPSGPPPWLGAFLDEIGLTAPERDHVLHWPSEQLRRTRAAVVRAVTAGQSPTFRWGLYDGAAPLSVERTGTAGNPEVLFQSPGASLRLTSINYGEVYVEEV